VLGVLAAAGGAFLFLWDQPVLQVQNPDRGLTRYFRLRPPERFSLTYRHSMYDAPVSEEFEAGAAGITLRGVSTRHPGVMEYYGFDRVRDYHPRDIVLESPLVVKKGIREGQGLVIHGRPISLDELAEAGERVELRVANMPLIFYLLRMEP
jgi:hypothetical protein